MSLPRSLIPFLVGMAVAASLAAGARVMVLGPPSREKAPAASDPYEVIQEFPGGGAPTETAWKVHWAQATSRGLYITGAWFKRGPEEPWMKVLGDTRVSDIFVPYHGHKY